MSLPSLLSTQLSVIFAQAPVVTPVPHSYLWIGFNVFVAVMLFLDLFVFNKKSHTMKVKESLLWTAFWVGLAGIFSGLLYYMLNAEKAAQFVTAYLIEESLSVDNLFVFLMLFTFFRTPTAFQHKVLFWGIIGAIFFRAVFILVGVELIHQFPLITYGLGVLLIYTAVRMFFSSGENDVNPDKNPIARLFSKFFPVTQFYDGDKFFTRVNLRKHATPLFIVLIAVETTDIVFAMDSIPAILAIIPNNPNDPYREYATFVAYSSNIFAVLGLRALYFALAGIMELFHYLHYGLSIILLFIGAKIIYTTYTHDEINVWLSLAIVGGILTLSILLSLIFKKKTTPFPTHSEPKKGAKPF